MMLVGALGDFIALVIFAQWRPERALVGAYLFGLFDVLELRSQAISVQAGPGIPFADVINPALEFLMHLSIIATYPHLAMILVLSVTVIRFDSK